MPGIVRPGGHMQVTLKWSAVSKWILPSCPALQQQAGELCAHPGCQARRAP
jgi:hypothetical protein